MVLRASIVLTVAALAVAAAAPEAGRGQSSGLEFADWTAASTTAASGTLLDRPISITGGQISPAPAGVIDGSSPLFSGPEFSPALPLGDDPEMRVPESPTTYTIDLGGPVVDPILHLASLGSTLTFPAGTTVVRRSGDPGSTGRDAAWTMSDRCDGTLTSVQRGRVAVKAGGRTVRVRPSAPYLIRARLFGARKLRG